ncbi:peptidase M15 [Mesorhizobium sp. SARCC-RB16n]|uniref:DUF882 domain-containing protein n=1 Tax=Mesorhizobium sp. SARCC-RB16n TaxID=2116687 RepID=UPI00122F5533|nr:DUF882 domain-containing protein [Mesorhizobium sp. SARCC-RB16n]KAA3450261.1 peptidase M15 [Mesorhizobium sp. SARCC-RB16n]
MNVIESEQNAPGGFRWWTRLPAFMVAFFCMCITDAFAETRALRIQHLHTGEKAEIVFKRNGRYDQAGLKKINFMLRDWRRNEPTRMDPRLLDLVWQAYRASGSTAYIHVVSAYRSPATNAMLRGRSKGVARESQHMVGRAMDFFLPDVPLKKLRDIGLKMQGGGVGYYPTSGSPFIHMDVGNVRHWPGISRQELARVFPNGNTLHVPSDGKPLPGYEQAFAAYKSRKAAGTPNIELASADSGQRRPARGLLASLLGGRGADEANDAAQAVPAPRKPAKSVEPKQAGEPKTTGQGTAIVAPEAAQRADIQIASAGQAEETPAKTPEAIVMAMAPGTVPLPAFAPRTGLAASIPTQQTVPLAVASASPARAEPAAANAEIPPAKVDAAAAAGAPEMVALNIPVPTWRPQDQASAAHQPEAKPADAIGALLAMHHADDGLDPLAGQRIAVPASKPEDRARTSPKADRVQPRLDPETTAVIVPLETGRRITGGTASAAATIIAANLIRTAPEQVYLDGFKPRGQTSDHRRFTGSAVKFLPIASFK